MKLNPPLLNLAKQDFIATRYDVFRFAQNDVARFTRNDAMFARKCGEATHH